jgi:hypothetical protein
MPRVSLITDTTHGLVVSEPSLFTLHGPLTCYRPMATACHPELNRLGGPKLDFTKSACRTRK